jgi:hypothetical protein
MVTSMNNNTVISDIQRSLGQIEGELVEIRKLSERISKLEVHQSWMKGLWAALAGAWAYLFRSHL